MEYSSHYLMQRFFEWVLNKVIQNSTCWFLLYCLTKHCLNHPCTCWSILCYCTFSVQPFMPCNRVTTLFEEIVVFFHHRFVSGTNFTNLYRIWHLWLNSRIFQRYVCHWLHTLFFFLSFKIFEILKSLHLFIECLCFLQSVYFIFRYTVRKIWIQELVEFPPCVFPLLPHLEE